MNKQKLKRLLIDDFTLKRWMPSIFFIVALVYFGLLLYSYFYAEKIIFQPQPSSYHDTNKIIKIDTGDGAKISAVYLPSSNARCTILYSHGNAEDIGEIAPTLEKIRNAGFSVFAYDYRGYGTSSGAPSEKNSYRDEDAAFNYLVNNLGVSETRIIAFGRSLGGGVAVDLAYRRRLGGLIIESSFTTAYQVLTRVSLFPFDKFKSISKIKEVHCPLLVIHGTRDEVIPFRHGVSLFEAANEPKLSFWVENAGHNDLSEIAGDRYAQVLQEFANLIEKNNG